MRDSTLIWKWKLRNSELIVILRKITPQFIAVSRIPEFKPSCLPLALKEKSKLGRLGPSVDLIQGPPPSSVQFSSSQRGQKRSTEDADSDVEFVCMTKIPKRSVKKRVKHQQSHVPPLSENFKLVEASQVSSWETKKRKSENLVQELKASTEVETSSRDPTVIWVWDETSTKVSLKQERTEVPLVKTEKQELCDDTPVMKRNPSALNWKRAQMENLSPHSGQKVSSVNGSCQLSSLMPSQSTSIKETARKLMSNLREILLYFIPEFQLSSEFECTSMEELITSPELEWCPESTNEKLKICFHKIRNIYMIQYEKRLKSKVQSLAYEANRRGVLNEALLQQCEGKRTRTEDKLNNLRVKLASLLQKLQLGGPAGDLEQIDAYLEALLKEDHLPTTLKEKTPESGHGKDREQ
ncbi:hypothetical protein STEG23_002085 [Scotinomys teguina]